MQIMPNQGSANFYPNTIGGGLPKQAPVNGTPEVVFVKGNVVYDQAGERYISLNSIDKQHLCQT